MQHIAAPFMAACSTSPRPSQQHAACRRSLRSSTQHVAVPFAVARSMSLCLSWMQSTTSRSLSSKSKVPQVNSVIRPAHDPEKQETRAKLSGDQVSHDQTRNKSPDPSHVSTRDKSRDSIHFGRARSPLINKWQTMGTVCNQRRHVTLVIG
jgi:hypothetical protein